MITCLLSVDVLSYIATVEESRDKMDIIVGSVKAFVKLCNRKDFSHLPERRLVVRQNGGLGGSDDEEENVGEEESVPMDIVWDERHRIRDVERVVIIEHVEEDSDEEFSSTEDSPVSCDNQRKYSRDCGWPRRP